MSTHRPRFNRTFMELKSIRKQETYYKTFVLIVPLWN